MNTMNIIDKVGIENQITGTQFFEIFNNIDTSIDDYLFSKANEIRLLNYGKDVYLRGLIEISNYCKNDCLYCGIRKSNLNSHRYRLSKEDILNCCKNGYALGLRTFVMQGGEDLHFTDDIMCDIISSIKEKYPDCAITLSLGEKSYSTYKKYFNSGADRYLLRHETADFQHYGKLHPKELSLKNRMECLYNLKDIGYQVGTGFMVGSPYQTAENLLADIRFMQELKPHMIGIGTFIPHKDTPFKDFSTGSLRDALVMIALSRLLFPMALIPSTTALETINPRGRELGLKAGGNVIMPNISPDTSKAYYQLYDNKAVTGLESLENMCKSIGYEVNYSRGDFKLN